MQNYVVDVLLLDLPRLIQNWNRSYCQKSNMFMWSEPETIKEALAFGNPSSIQIERTHMAWASGTVNSIDK